MRAANIRKLARYDALLQQIKDNLTGWEVNLHCMEIGTRGLIGTTMLETLTILKVPKKDNIQHQKNLKQIAAQSTQHNFRARHAHWWTEPNMSNDREEPMTVLQIAGTQPIQKWHSRRHLAGCWLVPAGKVCVKSVVTL